MLDNPFACDRRKVAGAYFAAWQIRIAVGEILLVPVDSARVILDEKIDFLDRARRADMAAQHGVEPRGRGARRSDAKKIRQAAGGFAIIGNHQREPAGKDFRAIIKCEILIGGGGPIQPAPWPPAASAISTSSSSILTR